MAGESATGEDLVRRDRDSREGWRRRNERYFVRGKQSRATQATKGAAGVVLQLKVEVEDWIGLHVQ